MPREKRNPVQVAAIARRITECLDKHLRLSVSDAAVALGYSNRTMLDHVRGGQALLDPLRLVKLARLRSVSGNHVDLHWVLTGEGMPLRKGRPRSLAQVKTEMKRVISRLDQGSLEAVLALSGGKE
jgi:hypothetical protein